MKTPYTTNAILKCIFSRKNTNPLPILIGLAVITSSFSEHVAPQQGGITPSSTQDIARFNRRFIQVNDYLLNGTEETTAFAYNPDTRLRHTT